MRGKNEPPADTRSAIRRAFDEIGNEPKPQPIVYRQQPAEREVPRLALYLLVVNMLIWLVAASLALLAVPGIPPAVFVVSVFAMAAMMFVTLAIYYIIWRFFWWFLALSASLTTLALAMAVITVLTGATGGASLIQWVNEFVYRLFAPIYPPH